VTNIKGLNWTKVLPRKPGQPIRWYLYSFRGGPRIGYHEGPRRPRIGVKELAAYQLAIQGRSVAGTDKVAELCREWLASPEWKALAVGTRRNWIRFVDMIEKRWGENKIALLNNPAFLPRIIKWRNEVASKPKTADERVKVIRQLLEWARINGRLTVNVAIGIPTLYGGGNRADIIWTDGDMQRFAETAMALDRPQMIDALWLAALTGLRLSDLAKVTFDHVGERTLAMTAAKASGKKGAKKRRRVYVPIIPELRALIDELRTRERRHGVSNLLVNSHGAAWSADGLGGSFVRVRNEAGVAHLDRDDEGAEPRPKHLHDLRGTYATKLILRGETDKDVADIMGWAPERVGNIRKVYVDQARVVVGIAERMGQ
jgi:integrase